MAFALKITGFSTGTLDLNGDVEYSVGKGWAPAVATRSHSQVAGRSLYNPVVENIPLIIHGTSEADLLVNLAALTEALDEAWRWNQGDMSVNAILLDYDIVVGASTVKAAILGPPPKARSLIGLPITFNSFKGSFEMGPINLSLLREGLWLTGSGETATSSSTPNGAVMTVTFTQPVLIPSPTKVVLAYQSPTSNLSQAGFLILAATADRLARFEAEANWDSAANYASVAGGALSSGGNLLRFTPPGSVLFYTSGEETINTILNDDTRQVGVFVNFRSSSVDRSWIVSAQITEEGATSFHSTQRIVIEGSGTTSPHWRFLGIVATAGEPESINISIKVDSTSGSPTLDMDQVLLVDIGDERTNILEFGLWSTTDDLDTGDLIIDHRAYVERDGLIFFDAATYDGPIPYISGNPYVVSHGPTLCGIYLNTSISGGTNDWLFEGSSANDIVDFTLQGVRQTGFLTPE